MKTKLLHIVCTLFITFNLFAQSTSVNPEVAVANNTGYYFIENKGQWHDEVLYCASVNGMDAWITKFGVVYDYYKVQKYTGSEFSAVDRMHEEKYGEIKMTRSGHVIQMSHQGASANPAPLGKSKKETYHNYFKGNNPAKWASHVGLFEEVLVKNIYDGIDQRWYFDNGRLRYDYIVHPGADYHQLQLSFKGTNNITTKGQELSYATNLGEVRQTGLYVYQQSENNQKQAVEARWISTGKTAGFELGTYDKTKTLIIDPIIYCTYVGSTNFELAYSIKIDATGASYICGGTNSPNYPSTAGVYDLTHNGDYDVFVSKMNAAGTSLVYSTFVGGIAEDRGYSMDIDGGGNVYVTGGTASNNFPTVFGAYDITHNGGTDAFIFKLNNAGTSLLTSTYVGGTAEDWGGSLAANFQTGEVYVTGYTASTTFPTTAGSINNSFQGVYDAFVLKLNAAGGTLNYSTYLGGPSQDEGTFIKIDHLGNAYVAGHTASPAFPTTAGAYDVGHNGTRDFFMTKINPTGSQILQSTFIGGSSNEQYPSFDFDQLGNIYITGYSNSANFPTTAGAYDTSPNGGDDAVVCKLNPTFTSLVYSTCVGAVTTERGRSIAVDAAGNAHVVGSCNSAAFPTTMNADQGGHGGGEEIVIFKLNKTGSSLLYSSYYGSEGSEYPTSVALSLSTGNLYITGTTSSTTFFALAGGYDVSQNGGQDAFILRMNICPAINLLQQSDVSICQGANISPFVTASGGTSPYAFVWGGYFANVESTSGLATFAPPQTNTYFVTGEDANGCSGVSYFTVTVNPIPTASAPSQSVICSNVALSPAITITTTGPMLGIGTPTGLPTGLSATFSGNTITITGTPTVNGTFNYNIPLSSGCGTGNATGTLQVLAGNTVSGTANGTVCVNSALTPITRPTTGATGIGAATGLPPGVTASFSANTITISGTPTTAGTFNYSVPLTGGCGSVNATGTITVNVTNTVTGNGNATLCVNSALTPIAFTTTGPTGIGAPSGLPAGVTAVFASNTITVSGTPTAAGTFNYSIPLTGGCGSINATGTITVNATNMQTVNGSANASLCVNTPLTAITFSTTSATGIGTPTGLPTGVTASFATNTITISGTPTVAGTFNYNIPLTGGCGNVNATGTITVNATNTVTGSVNATLCINTALAPIAFTPTGATGIGSPSGLPAGVTAVFASNTITVSGTPTVAGTFNYSIPLTGGCGSLNATGTITVNPDNMASNNPSVTVCVNSAINPDIQITTSGATGIGSASGLPNGVAATFNAGTITINGIPDAAGTYNYSIPLTGGCGSVSASGTIVVNAENSFSGNTDAVSCVNQMMNPLNITTVGVTGAGTATGLPNGVQANFSNGVQISGTPTQAGTFNYAIPLIGACGAPISITGTITVNAVDASASAINDSVLTATQSGATYQWVDCNNNNSPIAGATAQNFTASSNGNYAVQVTMNGCMAMSSCISVELPGDPSSINESEKWEILVYPNPANTHFNITNLPYGSLLTVVDMTGKVIHQSQVNTDTITVFSENWSSGVYVVQINNNGNTIQKKLVVNR